MGELVILIRDAWEEVVPPPLRPAWWDRWWNDLEGWADGE